MHRPLLVSVRKSDEVSLGELGAHERQSEWNVWSGGDEIAKAVHLYRGVGGVEAHGDRDDWTSDQSWDGGAELSREEYSAGVCSVQCSQDASFAAVEQVGLICWPELGRSVVPALLEGSFPDKCITKRPHLSWEVVGELLLFLEIGDVVWVVSQFGKVVRKIHQEVSVEDERFVPIGLPLLESREVGIDDRCASLADTGSGQ